MVKKMLLATMLMSSSAYATEYATGDCTAGNGTHIKYAIHSGKGFITYDNSAPAEVFTSRVTPNGNEDPNGSFAMIRQIGNTGNMVLAIDINTGRGYIITQFDNGQKTESNVYCKLGVANY